MIRVSEGFDETNKWWWFTVDSTDGGMAQRVNAATIATTEITEWCWERFGPPDKDDFSRWYVSDYRSFTIPDPDQAMEFKLRWATPS